MANDLSNNENLFDVGTYSEPVAQDYSLEGEFDLGQSRSWFEKVFNPLPPYLFKSLNIIDNNGFGVENAAFSIEGLGNNAAEATLLGSDSVVYVNSGREVKWVNDQTYNFNGEEIAKNIYSVDWEQLSTFVAEEAFAELLFPLDFGGAVDFNVLFNDKASEAMIEDFAKGLTVSTSGFSSKEVTVRVRSSDTAGEAPVFQYDPSSLTLNYGASVNPFADAVLTDAEDNFGQGETDRFVGNGGILQIASHGQLSGSLDIYDETGHVSVSGDQVFVGGEHVGDLMSFNDFITRGSGFVAADGSGGSLNINFRPGATSERIQELIRHVRYTGPEGDAARDLLWLTVSDGTGGQTNFALKSLLSVSNFATSSETIEAYETEPFALFPSFDVSNLTVESEFYIRLKDVLAEDVLSFADSSALTYVEDDYRHNGRRSGSIYSEDQQVGFVREYFGELRVLIFEDHANASMLDTVLSDFRVTVPESFEGDPRTMEASIVVRGATLSKADIAFSVGAVDRAPEIVEAIPTDLVAFGGEDAIALFDSVQVSLGELASTQRINSFQVDVAGVTDPNNEYFLLDGVEIRLEDSNSYTVGSGSVTVSGSNGDFTLSYQNATGLEASEFEQLFATLSYKNDNTVLTGAEERLITLSRIEDSGRGNAPNSNATSGDLIVRLLKVFEVNSDPELTDEAPETRPVVFDEDVTGIIDLSALDMTDENGRDNLYQVSLSATGKLEIDTSLSVSTPQLSLPAGDMLETRSRLIELSEDHSITVIEYTNGSITLLGSLPAVNAFWEQTANTQSALTLLYTPLENINGVDTLNIAVTDNQGAVALDVGSVALSITPVDDSPVVAAATREVAFDEAVSSAPVSVFSNVDIDLIDNAQTVTDFELRVDGLIDGAEEVLTIGGVAIPLVDGGPTSVGTSMVSVSLVQGTATITVTDPGLAVADAEALLNGITYQNTNPIFFDGERKVTLTRVTDSGDTTGLNENETTGDLLQTTITLSEQNDLPSVAGPPTSTSVVEDTLTNLDLSSLSLADPNLRGGNLTLTLSAPSPIHAVEESGIVITGSGTSKVTLAGTLSALNDYIAAGPNLKYQTPTDSNASEVISVQIADDQGSGTLSAGTITVNVTPVDDAPRVANITGGNTFVEGGDPIILFSEFEVDVVEADQTVTDILLRFKNASDGVDEGLYIDGTFIPMVVSTATTPNNSISVTITDDSGDLSVALSHSGLSPEDTKTLIRGIRYENTSNPATDVVRTVQIESVQDSGTDTGDNENTVTLSGGVDIALELINEAPVVSGLDPFQADRGVETQLDTDVSVFDADENWAGGEIVISNLTVDDVLVVKDASTTQGDITIGSNGEVNFTAPSESAVHIGTVTGGNFGDDLRVVFNDNATSVGVEATLEAVHVTVHGSADPDYTVTIKDGFGTEAGGAGFNFEAGSAVLLAPGDNTVRGEVISAADIDDDGDFDLIISGHAENPTFFRGTGIGEAVGFTQEFAGEPIFEITEHLDGISNWFFGDFDQDGHLDIISVRNTQFFRGDGSGGFNTSDEAFAPLDDYRAEVSFRRDPSMLQIDLNGDGALDILFADQVVYDQGLQEAFRVALNDGSGNYTFQDNADDAFPENIANPVSAPFFLPTQVSAIDYDLDGDSDLFLSANYGTNYGFLENIGSDAAPQFVEDETPGWFAELEDANVFSHLNRPATFVDIDRDGDLDALSFSSQAPAYSLNTPGPLGTQGSINDAPTANDDTEYGSTGHSFVLSFEDFKFFDPDTEQMSSVTIKSELPGLTLSGVPVAIDTVIRPSDVASGELVFFAGAETNGSFSVDFIVNDGSLASPDVATLSFEVFHVPDDPGTNTAPVLSGENGDIIMREGVSRIVDLGLSLSDLEGDFEGGKLKITWQQFGNLAFFDGSGLEASGSDVEYLVQSDELEVDGMVIGGFDWDTLENPTPLVSFELNEHATVELIEKALNSIFIQAATLGEDTLEVIVADSQGNEASRTIALTVQSANAQPIVSAQDSVRLFGEETESVSLFDIQSVEDGNEGTQNFSAFSISISGLSGDESEILVLDGSDVPLGTQFQQVGTTADSGLNYSVSVVAGEATISVTGANLTPSELSDILNATRYKTAPDFEMTGDRVATLTSVTDTGGTLGAGADTTTGVLAKATVSEASFELNGDVYSTFAPETAGSFTDLTLDTVDGNFAFSVDAPDSYFDSGARFKLTGLEAGDTLTLGSDFLTVVPDNDGFSLENSEGTVASFDRISDSEMSFQFFDQDAGTSALILELLQFVPAADGSETRSLTYTLLDENSLPLESVTIEVDVPGQNLSPTAGVLAISPEYVISAVPASTPDGGSGSSGADQTPDLPTQTPDLRTFSHAVSAASQHAQVIALFTGADLDPLERGQDITDIVLEFSDVENVSAEFIWVDGTQVSLNEGATSIGDLSVQVGPENAGAITISISGSLSPTQANQLVNGLGYQSDLSTYAVDTRTVTLVSVADSGNENASYTIDLESTVRFAAQDAPAPNVAISDEAVIHLGLPSDLFETVHIEEYGAGFGGGSLEIKGVSQGDRVFLDQFGDLDVSEDGTVLVSGIDVATISGGLGEDFSLAFAESLTEADFETVLKAVKVDIFGATRALEVVLKDADGRVVDGHASFVRATNSSPIDTDETEISMTSGDIDGDGDTDVLLSGSDGALHLFRRITNPEGEVTFVDQGDGGLGLSQYGALFEPVLFDVDQDDDLDLFARDLNGQSLFFRNADADNGRIGDTISFSEEDLADLGLPDFMQSLTFVDLNSSGLREAAFINASGQIQFLMNTGETNGAIFSTIDGAFNELSELDDATSISFLDVDADGDADVFVGRGSRPLSFYENMMLDGATDMVFAPGQTPLLSTEADPRIHFMDIDNDGDSDAIIASSGAGLSVYENSPAGFDISLATNNAPRVIGVSEFISLQEDPSTSTPIDLKGFLVANEDAQDITLTLIADGVFSLLLDEGVVVEGNETGRVQVTGSSLELTRFLNQTDAVSFTATDPDATLVEFRILGEDGSGGPEAVLADATLVYNSAPVLSLASGPFVVQGGDTVSFAQEVSLSDLDDEFDGGYITALGPDTFFSIDERVVHPVGDAGLTVAIENERLVIDGIDIGSFDSNETSAYFNVQLNANATSALITEFLTALEFRTVANYIGTRELTLTIADKYGALTGLTVTVNDPDDAAVVAGTVNGQVAEGDAADLASTFGTLSISDIDADDQPVFEDVASVSGTNGYGLFQMADSTWTYTLDQEAVQDLDAGDTVADTITFLATDGTPQEITVNIAGTEDGAIVTGTATGQLTEGDVGDLASTFGTLSISDIDADDQPVFEDVASVSGTNGYGLFQLADSTWTYTLDQETVQHLDVGDTVTDSTTLLATDGTPQEVTVTIAGTNDAPDYVKPSDLGVSADSELAITLLEGASDPEGHSVTVVSAAASSDRRASVISTLQSTGTLLLDPNQFTDLLIGQEETITIRFTLSDGTLETTAERDVVVAGVKYAPIAEDDSFSLIGNSNELNGNLLNTNNGLPDSHPDSTEFVVSSVAGVALVDGQVQNISLASGAILSVSENGDFVYAADQSVLPGGENDSFNYTVTDVFGHQDTAEVSISRALGVSDGGGSSWQFSPSDLESEETIEGLEPGDSVVLSAQTLNVEDVSVVRSEEGVEVLVDTDNDGTADKTILLDNVPDDGGFLVSSLGNGADARIVVDYVPITPEVTNRKEIDPDSVNGLVGTSFLTGNGARGYSIEFAQNDAGLRSMVGAYVIDASGEISDVQILFGNTKQTPTGAQATIDPLEEGDLLGLFLVAGGSKYASADQFVFVEDAGGDAANAFDDAAPILMADGVVVESNVFHAHSNLNAGGQTMVWSGFKEDGDGLVVGFEDLLLAESDRDYNDVLINVFADFG